MRFGGYKQAGTATFLSLQPLPGFFVASHPVLLQSFQAVDHPVQFFPIVAQIPFKLTKRAFSWTKCHSRSESAQSHFSILIAIAYLIINNQMKILQTQQQNLSRCTLFWVIRLAVTVLAEINYSKASIRTMKSLFSKSRYLEPFQ